MAPLQPYAIVAGAGSGKTQTMGLRVAWLVANGHVEPHRVLGLTFTRKAAGELSVRVRRMLRRLAVAHDRDQFLAPEVAALLASGEPTVSTYHGYAAALVAEHALRAGIEPSARLLGEAMTWQYAAEVVQAYDGPMANVEHKPTTVIADVLGLAGELAEHLATADDVRALSGRLRDLLDPLPRASGQRGKDLPLVVGELRQTLAGRLQLLPLVDRYVQLKRRRDAMDYGDQVALAARIARDDPAVGEIERSRFSAVLLDEYQDTGESQRVLLRSLYGDGHAVTAVGDPRQAIYGWRGASAGNLERFPTDFPRSDGTAASSTGLTVSFRNGERILLAANALADGITVRAVDEGPLRAVADRQDPGEVVCAVHETVDDEAAWVAAEIADRGRDGVSWSEMAVLVRRRSQFPALEAALRAEGVPCEVVGLGGLLLEPDVTDVVATLRLLVDASAGNAAVRVLAGPRWRIGPRDLDALGRRARRLALPAPVVDRAPADDDPEPDAVDERSLIDALDDLGSSDAYSPEGYRRLVDLRDELRRLRRACVQPLPDLVADVARTLELDVELASRPGLAAVDATVHVDRLIEVAEEFVASGEDPGLLAFLAYLDAAEERERGLEPDVAEPEGDRVLLLTVHAAKGLEWDVVAVAGLTRCVFPVEGQPVADWSKQIAALPFPLRGDRGELPTLQLDGVVDQKQAADAVTAFRAACKERSALEERRLAYVAVTRARTTLLCSGYWWDTAQKARGPSQLLQAIREAPGTVVAVDAPPPAPDAVNPLTARPRSASWPRDPLDGRRVAIEDAAALVRAGVATLPVTAEEQRWSEDVELLLREQAALDSAGDAVVELPGQLSVSQLVALRHGPGELARSLRRPLPAKPRPLARRGTAFHAWLETLYGQQRLLDVDEMPGAADESAVPDEDLLELQQRFRDSQWWGRVPVEVELPFETSIEGIVIRGRVDAIFRDDDGRYDVVDWKTGQVPSGAEAQAAAVQLAAYRLAWSSLSGVPLDDVRAAFHYVRDGVTVRPVDLLDADGLAALVAAVPVNA